MKFTQKTSLILLTSLATLLNINIIAKEKQLNPSCGCPYTETELMLAQEEELILKADTPATYTGGEKAYNRYISYTLQNPAKNKNDSDNFYLRCKFIVERDGTITHLEFINHTETKFIKEATQIILAMPKWNPAKKNGKVIRSWHSLKLFFGEPNSKENNT